MKEPFLSAIPVLLQLEAAGYEAYFVGGSVRDYLLNKDISDVDIATSATPEEVKGIFPRTVDIGIQHGTVLVLIDDRSYEITTFRAEGEYQDFRRPTEVSFIRNLKDDLQRRDFTMNAIAMDRHGRLFDPYEGQVAIKRHIIQTVGAASERFQEDALRMMRAVRFVSQLSFSIEEETYQALKEFGPLLEKIAVERKRTEFEKMMVGNQFTRALDILLQTNLYTFLPGLADKKEGLQKLLTFNCDSLNTNEVWALLLHCLQINEQTRASFLRSWRLPLKEMKVIQKICLNISKRMNQEWTVFDLYCAGEPTIRSTEKLNQVLTGLKDDSQLRYWLEQYELLPIKQRSEMAITGADLMIWLDKPGGPWLKETLLKAEMAILAGEVINDKQNIKEWLLTCSQK